MHTLIRKNQYLKKIPELSRTNNTFPEKKLFQGAFPGLFQKKGLSPGFPGAV